VVRYLGYVLVAVVALALAFGVGAILFGNLAERLAVPGNMRLVVFDEVVAQGAPVHVRAFLQSLDDGRPMASTSLVARTPDGWTNTFQTDRDGLLDGQIHNGLAAGRLDVSVGFPETSPRLDVLAKGSAWVLPRGGHVIWIDARAVVRPPTIAGSPVRVRPEDLESAGGAIKTVAEGRQPVYLVLSKAEEYGAIRRGLAESGLPEGPVWWVHPAYEAGNLAILKKASSAVDAALVTSDKLEAAVRPLAANVMRVPAAGEVVETLSSHGRTSGAGGVK
jgi:hypothetical protein